MNPPVFDRDTYQFNATDCDSVILAGKGSVGNVAAKDAVDYAIEFDDNFVIDNDGRISAKEGVTLPSNYSFLFLVTATGVSGLKASVPVMVNVCMDL